MKKLTILQTADTQLYSKMLDVSMHSFKTYCLKNNISYDVFFGLKKGNKPWHASLNRIFILKSYLDSGYDSWVIYTDADTYIVDQEYDIRKYLNEREKHSIIVAPSGKLPPRWWDVNIGVFAINMSNDFSKNFINEWHRKMMEFSDDDINNEKKWGDVVDDQDLFHKTLQDICGIQSSILIEESAFNWNSLFIRQRLRDKGSLNERIDWLKAEIQKTGVVVGKGFDSDDINYSDGRYYSNKEFIEALYRSILLRDPDKNGLLGKINSLNSGNSSYIEEIYEVLNSKEFSIGYSKFTKKYIKI